MLLKSHKGWVEAKDLIVGSRLQTDEETFIDIDRIERREGTFKVYNFEVEEFHTYFVSDLGVLVHNTCSWEDDIETIPLWRAVKDPELQDIIDSGMYRNEYPGWGGPKYFSSTPEGAASYAKQAYYGFPGDNSPYTLTETKFPKAFLTPDMVEIVDRNVPAIVLQEHDLPYLNPPIVLDSMPITGLRQ